MWRQKVGARVGDYDCRVSWVMSFGESSWNDVGKLWSRTRSSWKWSDSKAKFTAYLLWVVRKWKFNLESLSRWDGLKSQVKSQENVSNCVIYVNKYVVVNMFAKLDLFTALLLYSRTSAVKTAIITLKKIVKYGTLQYESK